MRFLSTRGETPPTDLKHALFSGLASDGGLFVPETYPPFEDGFLEELPKLSIDEIALATLGPYFQDIERETLRSLLGQALSFPMPLREIERGMHVLELFHGPTLAFKDVGARTMARLMAHFSDGEELTILVATSGDTGSAVAHAFFRVANTRVVILYPHGRVSELQEKQFTTLGENVSAIAVQGSFDDCQRMVKEAFADKELRERRRLTSANSINIGRLLPQCVYYVHATAELARKRAAAGDESSAPPVFVAPSGNFGNLCGGLIAHHMGLPASGFIAATNVNDVVPVYLDTGEFHPRASVETISNAMDVGNPSNFDRVLSLHGGSLEAIRKSVRGSRHTDDETRAVIREVFERTGYTLDPHTAVGVLAWKSRQRDFDASTEAVIVSTAHPAKFRKEVEAATSQEVEIPERLARAMDLEPDVVPMGPDASLLKQYLLAESAVE